MKSSFTTDSGQFNSQSLLSRWGKPTGYSMQWVLRLSILAAFTWLGAIQGTAQTCDCKEYIYVNVVNFDFTSSSTHKFEVNSGTGGLTEIGSPWLAGGTDLPFPHGLGTDRNGYLYIGTTAFDPNTIRRLDCAGNLTPTFAEDPINGFNTSNAGGNLYNIGSYDGFIYSNGGGGRIYKWDPCTGALIGYVDLGDGSDDWGFYIDDNGKFYATNSQGKIWVFTPNANDFLVNTTFSPVINLGANTTYGGLSPAYAGQGLQGITTDNAGNIYVVEGNRDGFNTPSRLLKFSPSFTFVAAGPIDNQGGNGGWSQMVGIVYSSMSGLLYTTSLNPGEDCVSRWTTDLVFDGVAIGPVPGSGGACKGIAIMTECCPTSATIDRTVCGVAPGERISLSELLTCDGIVCDGQWTEVSADASLTFNDCDLTVTVGSLPACGTYQITNTGTTGTTCDPYTITLNISYLPEVTAQVIAGNQTVCPTDDPAAFTITTAASTTPPGETITYQWQSSTTSMTTGFSNIMGAMSDTYDPGPVSQTTYYRVIASITGCADGVCRDTSNVVTLMLDAGCAVGCPSSFTSPDFEALGWQSSPLACGTNLSNNSQVFTNWLSSGVDVTFTYSTDMWDGDAPNIYKAATDASGGCDPQTVGANDVHCASDYWGALRWTNNDMASGETTMEISFGEEVTLDLLRLGSISRLGTVATPRWEWLRVRAYDGTNNLVPLSTSNATGGYIDCSNTLTNGGMVFLSDGAGGLYIHSQDVVWKMDGLYGHADISLSGGSPVYRIVVDHWASDSNSDPSNRFAGRSSVTINGICISPVPCVQPTANTPTTASGTCTGSTPNSDATITITGIMNADRVGISAGASYTGPAYGAATPLAGAMHTFTSLMHTTQYTIRLFNGADNCYIDIQVTTPAITCASPVSVGDYAWIDLNGNGLQDEANPLQGMKVTIYDVATNLPVALDFDGNPYVAMQTTDVNGAYLFTNLPPGNYYVVFDRGMIDNPDLYMFTVPNAVTNTQDALDSDATPTSGTLGASAPTGPLASGAADLTLDAGVKCNIAVEAGTPQTICSTRPLDLSLLGASITPSSLGGVWSSSGDGSFTGGNAWGSATAYVPGPNDILAGTVTLTLTSTDPANLVPPSPCGQEMDTVVITILKTGCGNFPWPGN